MDTKRCQWEKKLRACKNNATYLFDFKTFLKNFTKRTFLYLWDILRLEFQCYFYKASRKKRYVRKCISGKEGLIGKSQDSTLSGLLQNLIRTLRFHFVLGLIFFFSILPNDRNVYILGQAVKPILKMEFASIFCRIFVGFVRLKGDFYTSLFSGVMFVCLRNKWLQPFSEHKSKSTWCVSRSWLERLELQNWNDGNVTTRFPREYYWKASCVFRDAKFMTTERFFKQHNTAPNA